MLLLDILLLLLNEFLFQYLSFAVDVESMRLCKGVNSSLERDECCIVIMLLLLIRCDPLGCEAEVQLKLLLRSWVCITLSQI